MFVDCLLLKLTHLRYVKCVISRSFPSIKLGETNASPKFVVDISSFDAFNFNAYIQQNISSFTPKTDKNLTFLKHRDAGIRVGLI